MNISKYTIKDVKSIKMSYMTMSFNEQLLFREAINLLLKRDWIEQIDEDKQKIN